MGWRRLTHVRRVHLHAWTHHNRPTLDGLTTPLLCRYPPVSTPTPSPHPHPHPKPTPTGANPTHQEERRLPGPVQHKPLHHPPHAGAQPQLLGQQGGPGFGGLTGVAGWGSGRPWRDSVPHTHRVPAADGWRWRPLACGGPLDGSPPVRANKTDNAVHRGAPLPPPCAYWPPTPDHPMAPEGCHCRMPQRCAVPGAPGGAMPLCTEHLLAPTSTPPLPAASYPPPSCLDASCCLWAPRAHMGHAPKPFRSSATGPAAPRLG